MKYKTHGRIYYTRGFIVESTILCLEEVLKLCFVVRVSVGEFFRGDADADRAGLQMKLYLFHTHKQSHKHIHP